MSTPRRYELVDFRMQEDRKTRRRSFTSHLAESYTGRISICWHHFGRFDRLLGANHQNLPLEETNPFLLSRTHCYCFSHHPPPTTMHLSLGHVGRAGTTSTKNTTPKNRDEHIHRRIERFREEPKTTNCDCSISYPSKTPPYCTVRPSAQEILENF